MQQEEAAIHRRVGIIGAGGMLGSELVRYCREHGLDHAAWTDPSELDVTNQSSVDRAITDSFGMILNASGYTDVDGAEADPDAAFAVNGDGPARLAERCRRVGCVLVHYSTDYIFDGEADSPYPTDAVPRPVSVYGRSKLEGEVAVRRSGAEHLVVRTSWLFASHGRNFLRTIVELAADRSEVQVVNDQVGRPTWARDLVEMTFRLAASGARDVWNVTNDGQCSWYEWARRVVRLAGLRCAVRPCRTDEFPRPARRPAYSVLDLEPTKRRIGPIRPWEEALRACWSECPAVNSAP